MLLLCVLALAYPLRWLRVSALEHGLATQRYEDVYYLPPARWLPVLSLGYEEALADLLWLRSLIYFGQELEHDGRVRHIFEYADAMLQLDPHFKRAYLWVGMSGMYRPGGNTIDDVRRTIPYLRRAAELFPDDGDVAWELGASLTYELAPLVDDPDEKDALKEEGAHHLQRAVRLGEGPPWLALSNASQLQRLGRAEQAIRHLTETYDLVQDEATRQRIRARIAQLQSQTQAEAFLRGQEELEERRRREFPYVDPGFYPLLGPRPPGPGTQLLERGFDPVSSTGE